MLYTLCNSNLKNCLLKFHNFFYLRKINFPTLSNITNLPDNTSFIKTRSNETVATNQFSQTIFSLIPSALTDTRNLTPEHFANDYRELSRNDRRGASVIDAGSAAGGFEISGFPAVPAANDRK